MRDKGCLAGFGFEDWKLLSGDERAAFYDAFYVAGDPYLPGVGVAAGADSPTKDRAKGGAREFAAPVISFALVQLIVQQKVFEHYLEAVELFALKPGKEVGAE